MRLASVRIQNFRCYKEEIQVDFDDLTALIGKNDAGKSAILDALEIYFNEAKVDQDDGSVGSAANSLTITCEFAQSPHQPIVVDARYPTSLKVEYLLNKDGRLEITKRYDASLRTPKLKEVVLTAIHPSAPEVADLLSLKITDLKRRARELDADTEAIQNSINAQLRAAIRDTCPDLKLKTQHLLISDIEQGTGRETWQQIKNSLPVYFLFKADRPSTDQDQEAQDPLKEAIKLALGELYEKLDEIKQHVEDQVREVADGTLAKLREFDHNLAADLVPRFEEPRWQGAFKVALEDGQGISLNKRGSGVRRLVLLSFLQAQAERSNLESGRSAIYAIEEPETSQHPDNQRLLYNSVADLSTASSTQVLLTTHNPALGGLLPETSLRYVEVLNDGKRRVRGPSNSTYKAVADALGVLSSHKVKLFLGVEGTNDIDFLKGISSVLHRTDPSIPDLRALEAKHELIFIPFNGSNLWLWISRLNGLNCTEIHIVDRDNEPPAHSHYWKEVEEIRLKPRCKAFETSMREMENYLHSDAIACALGVEISVGDFVDVPDEAARALYLENTGRDDWDSLDKNKRKEKIRKVKKKLNTDAVAQMTVSMLKERDPNGDIRSWLDAVCEAIG